MVLAGGGLHCTTPETNPCNGFVSGVVQCSPPPARTITGSAKAPASEGGRYKCPDNIGADRPAGTREALPGAMRRVCTLRFKRKGTRRGEYPYEESRMACNFRARTEKSLRP